MVHILSYTESSMVCAFVSVHLYACNQKIECVGRGRLLEETMSKI